MSKTDLQTDVARPEGAAAGPRLQRDVPCPGERSFVFRRFSESYYFCPDTLECGVLAGEGLDESAAAGDSLRDRGSTAGVGRDDGREIGAPVVTHRAKCSADFHFPHIRLPRRGRASDGTSLLGLRHAVLNVSGRCNLGCRQCLVDGTPLGMPALDMSPDTAMRALELIETHREEGQGLVISLYGGEPLLNPALLHTILDRHREALHGRVGFWLCTNGTIFDEEIFEKLIALNGTILVSLGLTDGPGDSLSWGMEPEVLGKSTVGPSRRYPETQEEARKNIDMILARWPDRVAFVASTSRYQSVPQSLYQSLPEPIRERLTFRPWIPLNGQLAEPAGGQGDAPAAGGNGNAPATGGQRSHLAGGGNGQSAAGACGGSRPDEAEAFARALLERIRQRRLPSPVEGIALDEGFHRYLFRLFWRETRPWHCGAAASEISVAPDGKLYPCVFFAGCRPLAIGDVYSGLDPGKLDAFFRHVSRKRDDACEDCWARTLCDGGCPRRDFDLDGSPRPMSDDYCRELRATITRAIALYASASQDGALLYLMGWR
jgi:radical SAM protein with 4Fe4S-binding SPASM domain